MGSVAHEPRRIRHQRITAAPASPEPSDVEQQ